MSVTTFLKKRYEKGKQERQERKAKEKEIQVKAHEEYKKSYYMNLESERVKSARIQGMRDAERKATPMSIKLGRGLGSLGGGLQAISKGASKIDIGQAWSMHGSGLGFEPNYKAWGMGVGSQPRKRHHKKRR